MHQVRMQIRQVVAPHAGCGAAYCRRLARQVAGVCLLLSALLPRAGLAVLATLTDDAYTTTSSSAN
jgi:hypothetical protein